MISFSFCRLRYAIVVLFTLAITACSGDGANQSALLSLVAERDSLRDENSAQRHRLTEINNMISTINAVLDSISVQEKMLFIDPVTETPVSRHDVLRNLERYENVVRHQQNIIDQLRSGIGQSDTTHSLSGMLNVLQMQLKAKDQQIAQLKSELAKKDVNINALRKQVATQLTQIEEQSQTITQLHRTTTVQKEALVRQDDYLNSAYVIVGSKKDLERKGIIKKKRLVPESALDPSKFAKVDIRKYREVTFSAKKPKILTDMPRQSYSLTTDGNGNFTLKITSPDDFWKISNYLIIQTN